MISEEQQDQAALYVLGLLEPREAAAFESELNANAELRDIARELREAAGTVALTVPPQTAPASLKHRIMREITIKTEETERRFRRNAFDSAGYHGPSLQRWRCFAAFSRSIAYGWSANLPRYARSIR